LRPQGCGRCRANAFIEDTVARQDLPRQISRHLGCLVILLRAPLIARGFGAFG
jgi:hypothetical protein